METGLISAPRAPAVKYGRTMSAEKMVLLLNVSDDSELSEAQAIFIRTGTEDGEWIKAGVAKGWYQAHTIVFDGKPRYVVVWHMSDQNAMVVNLLAQLNGGTNFSAAVHAVKCIAKKFGCVAIEALTVRRGLVAKAIAEGFRPCGVALTLKIS